jgi:hypothetical protein
MCESDEGLREKHDAEQAGVEEVRRVDTLEPLSQRQYSEHGGRRVPACPNDSGGSHYQHDGEKETRQEQDCGRVGGERELALAGATVCASEDDVAEHAAGREDEVHGNRNRTH